MKRRDVGNAHEEAILEAFKNYCEKKSQTFKVIDRPDPPDAIVEINDHETWIEITDAFLNDKLAESITSYVAKDKKHRLVPNNKKFVFEPDNEFENILIKTIEKKYVKDSIGNIFKIKGPGILIVGINTPFNNALNLAKNSRIIDMIKNEIDQNDYESRFYAIYFYDPHSQELSIIFENNAV